MRAALLLAGLPIVALVAIAAGLASGVRGSDVQLLVLAVATLAVALVPVALDQGRPPARRHVLLSMFALVYMTHYVTPVFTAYIPAFGPIEAPGMGGSDLLPAHVAGGQTMALYGLVALLASYGLPLGRAASMAMPRPNVHWRPAVTLAVACAMLAFGWTVQVLVAVGALPPDIGSGVLSAFSSFLVYGNVLLTYEWLRARSPVAFFLLCVTVPVTSALGFFTGSKTYALIAPMMVVLTLVVVRRRIRLRWIVVGVLALVLLYPTNQFFRDVILEDNSRTVVDVLRDPNSALERVGSFVSSSRFGEYTAAGLTATGGRLDGLGVTSVIVRDTPRVSPFQNGRTLGLFFLAFVPRLFWPSKPTITIGNWITEVYGSGPDVALVSATGPTQVGDYYLNFGTAGVIGGMMLLGTLLRMAHEALLRDESPTAPAILAAIVVLYNLTIRFEGNVAAQYANTAFALIPIAVIALAVRVAFPEARPRGAPAHSPRARRSVSAAAAPSRVESARS